MCHVLSRILVKQSANLKVCVAALDYLAVTMASTCISIVSWVWQNNHTPTRNIPEAPELGIPCYKGQKVFCMIIGFRLKKVVASYDKFWY